MPTLNIPDDNGAAQGGYAGALERGRQRRIEWTQDGTLLAAKDFAESWGVPMEALAEAEERHELFSVSVEDRRWYPAELLRLGHAATAAICGAMVGEDAARMLIFVLRKHGGLAGKTVAEATGAGELPRVVELAAEWCAS